MLPNARAALRAALVTALVALLAVGASALLGPVPAASAHAELISSAPADGATVTAPPAAVTLTFSDPIDARYVRIRLVTPAGERASTATAAGPVVTVPVPDAGAGGYQVLYRVVSQDGHPVSGDLRYTVRGTATGSGAAGSGSALATGVATATAPAASTLVASLAPQTVSGMLPSTSSGGSGTTFSVPVLVLVVAGLVLVLFALARRRGRSR